MTDNIWDDEDDDVQDESKLIKDLRKLVRDEKAKTKQYEDELKTLRPTVRKTQVSSLLTKLNVNPKIAGLVPTDIDATEDGIKAWVEEYGDIFGAVPATSGDPTGASSDNSSSDASSEDPEVAAQAAQWQRIQTQSSATGNTTPDKESQQLAMLQAAQKAANGNTDLFFAMLKGDAPIPS